MQLSESLLLHWRHWMRSVNRKFLKTRDLVGETQQYMLNHTQPTVLLNTSRCLLCVVDQRRVCTIGLSDELLHFRIVSNGIMVYLDLLPSQKSPQVSSPQAQSCVPWSALA